MVEGEFTCRLPFLQVVIIHVEDYTELAAYQAATQRFYGKKPQVLDNDLQVQTRASHSRHKPLVLFLDRESNDGPGIGGVQKSHGASSAIRWLLHDERPMA